MFKSIFRTEFQIDYQLLKPSKLVFLLRRWGSKTCLVVQWLGLHSFAAGGPGSTPGGETKIPQAGCRQIKRANGVQKKVTAVITEGRAGQRGGVGFGDQRGPACPPQARFHGCSPATTAASEAGQFGALGATGSQPHIG